MLMKQTKKRWNSILWVEACGFSFLIGLCWLSEATNFPHLIFNEPFVGSWHRAVIRTVVLSLVWAWVHVATRRLLKRLYYLENFLLICSWCRKVCHQDEWLTMEKYFDSQFKMHTSHGMCPACVKAELNTIGDKKPDLRKSFL